MISFKEQPSFNQSCAIVLLTQDQWNVKHPKVLTSLLNFTVLVKSHAGFHAEQGEVMALMHDKTLILLVGLGKENTLSSTALRIAVRKAILHPSLAKLKNCEFIPHNQNESTINSIIEGVLLGSYRWDKYLTKPKDSKIIKDKSIAICTKVKASYKQTIAICEGVNTTRDLVNENADITTSEYFEKEARAAVRNQPKASIKVLGRKELTKLGMNLHLAVNQGSNKEPKLILVQYSGGRKSDEYTALVGKGLTYDTGGLNLKPTGNIESMKMDMGGAAAVFGVMKNILSLKPKVNVIFAMAMAENAIDANSYKPGDVYTGYAGKSVEIGNTDAEGRLVLADAISYLVKNYKPKQLIDMATLTGACIVALGHDYTGLFSNNERLAKALLKSADQTDDRAWQLPIYPELKLLVKSKVADIKNIGVIRAAAGACTAAEFLRQFTDDTPWVHLDIAGSAYNEYDQRMYFGHGATGAGVRMVTDFLMKSA